MKGNSVMSLSVRLFSVVLLLILGSCKESTTPQEGAISGSVMLDNQSDHSGVSVLLFASNIVPDEIRAVCNQYSQLGIQPNNEQFFDHRYYSPMQSVSTDTNGNYAFYNVPYGTYILVMYKDGWGFKYIYNIVLNDESVILKSKTILNLVITFPNVITEDIFLTQGRTYHVNQNSYLPHGKRLVIEDGAQLLISPGIKLTIEGIFEIQDSNPMLTFVTSSDKIYASGTPSYGGSIEILPNAQFDVISGCKIVRLADGFVLRKSDVAIERSVIRDCSISFFSSNVSNHVFSRNIFIDCLNHLPTISTQQTSDITIQNNIFMSNYLSISLDFSNNALIQNNYFTGGNTQLSSVFQSVVLVKNNIFKDALRNVLNASKSNMVLNYNEISGDTCIHLGSGEYNTIQQGWTIANFNNLAATTYSVRADSRYYHTGEFYPLDFADNYWNTTNADEIDALIWDYNDYQNPPEQSKWGKVIYTPYRITKVNNAGIQ